MIKKIADIHISNRIRKEVKGILELAINIQEVGLIHPISIDSESNLLCGLRRLKACELLGWTEIECKEFPLNVEADENLFRQEFTPEEKVRGLERIEERERGKARGRMLAGTLVPTLAQGRTRDIVAQRIGWGHTTYEKAKAVLTSGQQTLIDMMNKEGNINKAYRYIKQKEDEKRILEEKPLLELSGKFKTILIDPPWQYETNVIGRTIPTFATQQVNKIVDITRYADDNCHLYLWATNAFIPKACLLIEDWGFEYKTLITWVKPSFGIGSYFRNSTEHLLFAVKGQLSTRVKDIATHFEANRGEYSEKPEQSYTLIEKASYPPYLEIYARKDRKGDWKCVGLKS